MYCSFTVLYFTVALPQTCPKHEKQRVIKPEQTFL